MGGFLKWNHAVEASRQGREGRGEPGSSGPWGKTLFGERTPQNRRQIPLRPRRPWREAFRIPTAWFRLKWRDAFHESLIGLSLLWENGDSCNSSRQRLWTRRSSKWGG